MKNIYLVERTDEVNYDEYVECIILAENKAEVNKIIDHNNEERYNTNYKDNGISDRKITKINLNSKSRILVENFMAG